MTCSSYREQGRRGEKPIELDFFLDPEEDNDMVWIGALVVTALVAVILRQGKTLKRQALEVERLAMTDGLTNLYNRRTFDRMLDREVERAKRSGKYPSLIFMDVDGMKQINDQQGHAMGDDVLVRVSGAIRNVIRFEIDVPCRYGGDEFVVVLPETPSVQAVKVGERIQESLKSQHIRLNIGVVECQPGWASQVFIHNVDKAMHNHKRVKQGAPA